MAAPNRVSKAIEAAASGPPPVVEPHSFSINLTEDRRFVAMAPIDMTDVELMGVCSILLREGMVSLRAERAKRESGLFTPPPPTLLVPN